MLMVFLPVQPDGDAIADVYKGTIGLWLQGGNDIRISNTQIMNISQNSLSSKGTSK
jgi:hypothetical protein